MVENMKTSFFTAFVPGRKKNLISLRVGAAGRELAETYNLGAGGDISVFSVGGCRRDRQGRPCRRVTLRPPPVSLHRCRASADAPAPPSCGRRKRFRLGRTRRVELLLLLQTYRTGLRGRAALPDLRGPASRRPRSLNWM